MNFRRIFNKQDPRAGYQLISLFLGGCKDITQEVTNGITTDRASTTVGTAPFTPGDTVTFT